VFFKKSDVLAKADKYLRQKKYNLALEEFLKYLQKNPNDVNIINRVGDLYAQIGEKEKAVDFFVKSADYYYKEGFYTKAIAILRKIIRITPDNIKMYERLADLYVQDGNNAEARRVYLEIADKYTKQGLKKRALEIYKKMVELDPYNIGIRLKLADAFIKEGMREEAADQLISTAKKLIKMNKNEDAKQLLTSAKKLGLGDAVVDVTLAEVYIEKREYEKAEQILDRSYAKNTGNSILLELLAFVKLKLGKVGEALKIAKRLFELDKSRSSVIETIYAELIEKDKINEGWSLIKPVIDFLILNEDFDRAIDLLKMIIDKKEYFIPALKTLAQVYERKGDRIFCISILEKLAEAYRRDGNVEEARATFKKLLEYDPANIEYKEALKNLKTYEISDDEISVSEEDFELDEDELVESLDLEDTTQKLLGGISEAEFYVDHGYKDKAYALLEQILRKDPLNKKGNLLLLPLCKERGERAKASQCYLNLAEIAMNERDYEKAEDYLNQSERLLPGSSGFLRRELKRRKKAEGMVEVESFDFEPDNEEISVIDVADSIDEESIEFEDEEIVGLGDESVSVHMEYHDEGISIDNDMESELEIERAVEESDLSSEVLFEEEKFEEEKGSEEDLFEEIGEKTLFDEEALLDSLRVDEKPLETPDVLSKQEQEKTQPEIDIEEESVEEEVEEILESKEEKIESVDLFEELGNIKFNFEDAKTDSEIRQEVEDVVDSIKKQVIKKEKVEKVIDLTDEIAEIEFYISQNLFEEAEDLLNNLVAEYPDHKDVIKLQKKFNKLKKQSESEQLISEKSGDFEDLLEEEFIDLKSQFGEELDIFQENTELTDTAPQEEIKSLDELFKEFKKGVEEQIDQEDYETHYNLGIAYKEMGLFNEAIEEFVKASHDPDRLLDCSFMIAGVYSELGEYPKAIEWLESGLEHAKKSGKDDKPILYELATLCEKNGDKEKARSYYQMIYKKDPNYRDISSKLK